ncbi:hypothetical protein D3C75_398580 [compost metagenome]
MRRVTTLFRLPAKSREILYPDNGRSRQQIKANLHCCSFQGRVRSRRGSEDLSAGESSLCSSDIQDADPWSTLLRY